LLELTLYSNLSQVCIRTKCTRELQLWTLAHALDPDGSGWVEISWLERHWPRSDRNLRTVIKLGLGIFWRKVGDRLYLYSGVNVGIALKTILGRAIHVDWQDARSLKQFRAHCYSSSFSRERIIARSTLQKIYNVTTPTLRSWEQIANVQRQTNIAVLELDDPLAILKVPDREVGEGVWFYDNKAIWQLPNTIFLKDPRTAPKPSRTDRKIRHALQLGRAPTGCRLYWEREDKALLLLGQGKLDEAYIKTKQALGKGTIWQYHS
jgi:hypothetical protein